MNKRTASAWDLTALLNAADPKASLPERHLWLIRLLEWLRHAPVEDETRTTPTPVLRLKHMLGVLERNPEHLARVTELLGCFLHEVDTAALLADFGFARRTGLWGELGRRLRARLLPLTPATNDLAELFGLLFPKAEDATWLDALDDATLARLVTCVAPAGGGDWRVPFFDATMFLASTVRAAGFSPALRQRMSPELLVDTPFRQLAHAAEQVRVHVQILHLTVATKQPAMTAHAMAEKLGDVSSDAAVQSFVDEVAHLIRSQSAGIFGNVVAVIPVVLVLQWLWRSARRSSMPRRPRTSSNRSRCWARARSTPPSPVCCSSPAR